MIRIDEDAEGTIWIFTDPGLSRIRNNKLEVVQSIDGEPVRPYLQMPQNVGGDSHLFGLWRLGHGRYGLQRFAYGEWSDVPLPPNARNAATVRIEAMVEDSHRGSGTALSAARMRLSAFRMDVSECSEGFRWERSQTMKTNSDGYGSLMDAGIRRCGRTAAYRR